MDKMKITEAIPRESKGYKKSSFAIVIPKESGTVELEYVSYADGGPLMRPKTPPGN